MNRQPILIAAMLLLARAGFAQTAPPPALPPATLALVTSYADGRNTLVLVSERPSTAWTPNYPRIAASQAAPAVPSAGGLPGPNLRLQFAWVRAGNDVRVTVSMLGPGLREEQHVATVTVARGVPVVVDELRKYSVEPVRLSVVDAVPMVPYLPTVMSIAPEIDVTNVTLLSAPYPGYRVTVRNVAKQSVALFGVQSYRGTTKALSRLERGSLGRPAMAPGESHTFVLTINGGNGDPSRPWSPEPIDVIEIDSVLWEDGTQVGQHGFPLNFGIAADGGRRLQLQRAIRVLQSVEKSSGNATSLLVAIRRGFEDIPEPDDTRLEAGRRAMAATKNVLLTDLDRFERSAPRDASEVQQWIRVAIQRYQDWLKRLAA